MTDNQEYVFEGTREECQVHLMTSLANWLTHELGKSRRENERLQEALRKCHLAAGKALKKEQE